MCDGRFRQGVCGLTTFSTTNDIQTAPAMCSARCSLTLKNSVRLAPMTSPIKLPISSRMLPGAPSIGCVGRVNRVRQSLTDNEVCRRAESPYFENVLGGSNGDVVDLEQVGISDNHIQLGSCVQSFSRSPTTTVFLSSRVSSFVSQN